MPRRIGERRRAALAGLGEVHARTWSRRGAVARVPVRERAKAVIWTRMYARAREWHTALAESERILIAEGATNTGSPDTVRHRFDAERQFQRGRAMAH